MREEDELGDRTLGKSQSGLPVFLNIYQGLTGFIWGLDLGSFLETPCMVGRCS